MAGKQLQWVEKEEQWPAPLVLTHCFMLCKKWGHRMLQASRAEQAWGTEEESNLNWMQHITSTLPVNSYLHRIGKHKTIECKWSQCRQKGNHYSLPDRV